MAEAPCGCYVDETVHADTNTERGQIMFCPMHAAAEQTVAERDGFRGELEELHRRTSEEKADMLAALENRMTKDGGHLKMSYDHRECEAVAAVIDAARGGAPVRDLAKEALALIAAMHREGEPLEGTHEEHCERSTAAAYSELDRVIVMAREARGGGA